MQIHTQIYCGKPAQRQRKKSSKKYEGFGWINPCAQGIEYYANIETIYFVDAEQCFILLSEKKQIIALYIVWLFFVVTDTLR